MAEIPYSPVANVTSEYTPTPQLKIDTPAAAFGATIGNATGELLQRAEAMQQLKNETDARNQTMQALKQTTDEEVKFKTQFGQDAGPEQFAAYQQRISDIRTQNRASLSSPMAQKMYDDESSRIMMNAYFSGASHSAQELKKYSLTTSQQGFEAATNTVKLDPENEDKRALALQQAEQTAHDTAAANGWHDPELINSTVAKARSHINTETITSLAESGRVGPAKALMDKVISARDITGDDLANLRTIMFNKENQFGSKSIVDNLYQGTNFAPGRGKVPIEKLADGIAMGIESHGSYTAVGPAVMRNGVEAHAYGKYQVMDYSLPGFLAQAHLPSMSPQEFLGNKEAQEKVFQTVIGGYQEKYGSANNAAVAWFAGEGALQKQADGTWAPKPGYGGDGHTTIPGYLSAVNKRMFANMSGPEKEALVRGEATSLDKDNEVLPELSAQRLASQESLNKHLQQASKVQNDTTIDDEITKQLQSGQPVTIESLSGNPDVARVISKMDPMAVQKRITSWQNIDNNPSQARVDNYHSLIGLAHTSPQELLNVDLSHENLMANDRKRISKLQNEIASTGDVADPAMKFAASSSAVKQIAASVFAAPDKKGSTEWNKFIGALGEEIKFEQAQGKNPSREDIVNMASGLAKRQGGFTVPIIGLHLGGDFIYRIPLHLIHADKQEKFRAELRNKNGGQEPTDPEVENYAAKVLYSNTLGGSRAKPL